MTKEQEEKIEQSFNDCDGCRSCGWHSAWYEVRDLILDYIDCDAEYYDFPCTNYDDEDCSTHRGYRLYDFKLEK